MYLFDEDLETKGYLGHFLRQAFPGHKETPFHQLLPALVGNRSIEYFWENPLARGLGAKIDHVKLFSGRGLILRLSKTNWDDINGSQFFQGRLNWHCQQVGPGEKRRQERDEKWVTVTEASLGGKGDIYVACPLGEIRELIGDIKTLLNIGSIWASLDVNHWEGSWSELAQAESLYPKCLVNLEDPRAMRLYNNLELNKWCLTAAEQRIEII
ncbi:hypothetical protein CkaCkLH20_06050 [Colletotrichum karsti]|uniref:Uncharacterized protein n=1 Tax=Colletotrichum karsti TaxID=1095194 RepID=A0A9P6I478_9PEZI|nr:uncharacterized protein CkaCkLH20_06050 [Colletotrichum karsti]KAF9876642.1 hypothetical protein CkaCkLH20_06050 [Colletotrichum karsti]